MHCTCRAAVSHARVRRPRNRVGTFLVDVDGSGKQGTDGQQVCVRVAAVTHDLALGHRCGTRRVRSSVCRISRIPPPRPGTGVSCWVRCGAVVPHRSVVSASLGAHAGQNRAGVCVCVCVPPQPSTTRHAPPYPSTPRSSPCLIERWAERCVATPRQAGSG